MSTREKLFPSASLLNLSSPFIVKLLKNNTPKALKALKPLLPLKPLKLKKQ